ncbi:MAG: class E sortase [Ilumatobacteraceae bacterium]
MLIMALVLSVSLLLHLGLVSGLQQRSAQTRMYNEFRSELAQGTAPIGPADADGVELADGTPVAYMEIRAIGLETIVAEGTSAEVLFDGPGHRRDTQLPGQVGSTVLFGRASTYGGPFDDLGDLRVDDRIVVTTGQGTFEYAVIGVRRAGDPLPPAAPAGGSRLMLVTADGSPFLSSGVLRVDADLVGQAVVGDARAISAAALGEHERAMGNQTDTVWALALWMQALTVLSVLAIWAWTRWGRAQAWIVFTPPLTLVGISASAEIAKLLPNLT